MSDEITQNSQPETASEPSSPLSPMEAALAAVADKEPEAPQAAVAAPVEPEPAPEPPAPEPRVSRALQTLREQERALQAEREKISQEKQGLEAFKKYKDLHELAAEKDVLGALEQMGFDPEEVADAIVENRGVKPKNKAEAALTQRLEALEAQIREAQTAEQKRGYDSQLRAAQQETAAQIKEASPLLAGLGDTAVDSVIETFQAHYNETGQTLTYSEAISRVESEFRSFIKDLSQNEEVRKLLLAEQAPSNSAPPATPSKTLSNQAAATVTQRQPDNTQDLQYDQHTRLDLIDKIIALG